MMRKINTKGKRSFSGGFTLIEVLVVVSIIGLLLSILIPSMRKARARSRAVSCGTNLRTLGQAWTIYAGDNRGLSVPGRLPAFEEGGFSSDRNVYRISTGMKYRPRWPALLQDDVGDVAIRHPSTTRSRQNYHSKVYVCPSVSGWTDERNAAYGYNYQFLGSHRLNEGRLRNLPVPLARIRAISKTVVMADSNGSAAAFGRHDRADYSNQGRNEHRRGNYGWILDPPRLEATSSRAGGDGTPRTAPDERHSGTANVLFADGHVHARTLTELGYAVASDGSVLETDAKAHNRFFSGRGTDEPPP